MAASGSRQASSRRQGGPRCRALFKWGARKARSRRRRPSPPPASPRRSRRRRSCRKFLAALAHQPSPVLLDLGPVVGANIAFFGERLAARFTSRTCSSTSKRTRAAARATGSGRRIDRRGSTHDADSVDGILCWDLFDFLDRPTGQALAARLARLLRQGGVLYGFFGTTPVELTHYTRFVVEADDTLAAAAVSRPRRSQRNVLVTRDINRMFDGLAVAESVLLKSNTRETLFRKP